MVERDILMVDFDGTLTKGGRFWTDDKILPDQEMIDWSNKKYHQGHVIIIFSARPYEVMRETVAWLIKYGVKYHGLNFDKPGAQKYIDDKAVDPKDLFVRSLYFEVLLCVSSSMLSTLRDLRQQFLYYKNLQQKVLALRQV